MNISFAGFFSGMSAIVWVLLAVGLIAIVLDMFTSGIGLFSIAGGLCLLAGIVVRLVSGKEPLLESFIYVVLMVVLLAVLLGVLFSLVAMSAKNGILSRSPFVQSRTALPVNKKVGEDFSFLIKKQGVIVSDCRPIGKAKIDGQIYEVIAVGEYIYCNNVVSVIKVDGNKVTVEKI